MKKIPLIIMMALLTACGGPAATTSSHALGSDAAKVTIEEFADLECPACAQATPLIEQYVRDHADQVRYEYHHFPLSFHEHAFVAAAASECASDQNQFWEFIAGAFRKQDNLNDSVLSGIAKELSLDGAAFKACMDGGEKKAIVRADMAEGAIRQISATPALFLNGKNVPWTGMEDFVKAVNTAR